MAHTFLLSTLLFWCTSALKAQDLFLDPPLVIEHPSSTETHHQKTRQFTGIPSLAIADNGRMWAVWYAGPTPKEDENNYVVLSTSGDGGHTWKEVLAIDPDLAGPVRAFDPEVWIDPAGRLRIFWAQAIGHDGTIAGVWCMKGKNPEKETPKWSGPERLTDGIMMCKPIVLGTGEWVLPVSTWRKTDYSAKMVVSEDRGRSWQVRGACHIPEAVRSYDEHIITEREDGSLWMLVRTNYGIGESISKDRGRSWSSLTPSDLAHPSARFFVRRLQSGSLLLVKHGPLHTQTGRSHLTAYISDDDGKSWTGGLLLDERKGVSYPDGQQTADGTIHIIYDYNRRQEQHIIMAQFTEKDVRSGNPDHLHRVIVADGGKDSE